jgi:hypothetical protein
MIDTGTRVWYNGDMDFEYSAGTVIGECTRKQTILALDRGQWVSVYPVPRIDGFDRLDRSSGGWLDGIDIDPHEIEEDDGTPSGEYWYLMCGDHGLIEPYPESGEEAIKAAENALVRIAKWHKDIEDEMYRQERDRNHPFCLV